MVEEIILMFVGDREKILTNSLDPLVMSALKDLRCSSPYSEPIIEQLISDYYNNSSIGDDSDLTDLINNIGISPNTLARLSKEEFVKMETIAKIALYFGVQISDVAIVNKEN